MRIETKHNIGDTVYYHSNKIFKMVICGISIHVSYGTLNKKNFRIYYDLAYPENPKQLQLKDINEKYVFDSVENLLENLKNNIVEGE